MEGRAEKPRHRNHITLMVAVMASKDYVVVLAFLSFSNGFLLPSHHNARFCETKAQGLRVRQKFRGLLDVSWQRNKLSVVCLNREERNDFASSENQGKFNFFLNSGSAKDCIEILKSDISVNVTDDQGWKLLNCISANLGKEELKDQQSFTSHTFASLRKRQILKTFGYIEATPSSLPLKVRDVDVPTLETITGLSLSALTPKGSELTWQVAGVALCAAQFALAKALGNGNDPLLTVIPATGLAFVTDRIFLSGAVFESIYRFLFPQYRDKVVRHEAGHFLLAYLMGCPIQGFFLSAWDANRAGIPGQAGCVFFDNDLSAGLSANKVSRVAIDRYSIVVMGGIAAEALNYQRAEGGASDESLLVSLLLDLTPPWDQQRVLNQARWAVTQAVLLLQEHQAAYDALVSAMNANQPLGECIKAIESCITARPASGKDVSDSARASAAAAPQDPSTTPLPSRLAELEAAAASKNQLLNNLEQEERLLEEKILALERQESYIRKESANGQWGPGEGKRMMDFMLKAARRRRAEAKSDQGPTEDGVTVGNLELGQARYNTRLAGVELQLAEKEQEIVVVEQEIISEKLKAGRKGGEP